MASLHRWLGCQSLVRSHNLGRMSIVGVVFQLFSLNLPSMKCFDYSANVSDDAVTRGLEMVTDAVVMYTHWK